VIRRLALPALVLALASPAVRAQQALDLADPGGAPMQIQAADALEWRQEEKLFVARGDAVVTRGDLTVRAPLLGALYREDAAGDIQIYRVTAQGGVVITRGKDQITGGSAQYDIDTRIFLMTGGNLRITNGEDVITATRSLEYREADALAIARGNATAVRGEDRLTADTLIGHFAPGSGGGTELSRVEAEGGVRITTPTDIVTGERGTYDVTAQLATLTGDVKLTRGRNQLNGDYAEIDLGTGISRLSAAPGSGGRVQGLLVPEREDSGASTPPPPDTPATP
jgi:lipopolysaccharide export system protein LptA